MDVYPVNLPSKYREETGRKKTTSVSIKYDSSAQKEKDIVIEGTIIECRPKSEDDRVQGSTGHNILVGIPKSTFNFISSKIIRPPSRRLTYQSMGTNQEHIWMNMRTLSEFTGKTNLRCQVYRDDLKKFETKGTLLETCKQLDSNIVGFGQFSVYITKDDKIEYYLTGFQLTNFTTIKSYSQPEIEVSPPDDIISALGGTRPT